MINIGRDPYLCHTDCVINYKTSNVYTFLATYLFHIIFSVAAETVQNQQEKSNYISGRGFLV